MSTDTEQSPEVVSALSLEIEQRLGCGGIVTQSFVEDRMLLKRCHDALAGLTSALTKINDIRNSIVGTQTVNFPAHVYPLVAALNEAGFKGEGYEVAHAKAATLIQQRDAATSALAIEKAKVSR